MTWKNKSAERIYHEKPEQAKEKKKEYYRTHKEEAKVYARKYYQEHKESALKRLKEFQHGYIKRIKLDVMQHYSKSEVPFCACCGEKTFEFLTIDHVNSDGAEHRRKVGNKTNLWIRRNNYPDGFQVLCYNCNCARYYAGCCPHMRK